MRLTVIAVTAGEPAGIGPELCVRLMTQPRDFALVYIADPKVLQAAAHAVDLNFAYETWPGRARAEKRAYVLPITAAHAVVPGRLDKLNAPYVIATLDAAVDGSLRGEFDAIVTAPVHKGVINDAGIAFSGHTEFIGERCGVKPVMMLACPDLRVALATTHLPLAEVSRHITRAHLRSVITTLDAELKRRFRIAQPRIGVCGLNPHAGESGYLGREEIDVIGPVITELTRAGLQLRGPIPADTAFLPAQLAEVDAVLAMYHDQGLPVLKHHDFAHAVNITLGLPFVRTSVDHGTALELAGRGRASPSSLYAAVAMARELIA
jgi:4-hydroxythreonine-4-phosphate dehydrogenase